MKYKLNQIATTVLHLPPENALPKSRPLIQMHPVEEKNPNDHQTEDIFNVNLAWDTSIHFYQTKYLNKTSPLLYMTGGGGGHLVVRVQSRTPTKQNLRLIVHSNFNRGLRSHPQSYALIKQVPGTKKVRLRFTGNNKCRRRYTGATVAM